MVNENTLNDELQYHPIKYPEALYYEPKEMQNFLDEQGYVALRFAYDKSFSDADDDLNGLLVCTVGVLQVECDDTTFFLSPGDALSVPSRPVMLSSHGECTFFVCKP